MPVLFGLKDPTETTFQLLQEDDPFESFDDAIKINHEFAREFEARKRREELQQLATKYDKKLGPGSDQDDDESDDESDTSSDEDDNPMAEVSKDIELLRTLAKIRAKDEEIYNSEAKFYSEPINQESNAENKIIEKTSSEKSTLSLKEYSRNLILSGSYLNESDNDDNDPKTQLIPTYSQDQKALKEAVLKAAFNKDDLENDEEDLFSKSKNETHNSESKAYAKIVIDALSKVSEVFFIFRKKTPRKQ